MVNNGACDIILQAGQGRYWFSPHFILSLRDVTLGVNLVPHPMISHWIWPHVLGVSLLPLITQYNRFIQCWYHVDNAPSLGLTQGERFAVSRLSFTTVLLLRVQLDIPELQLYFSTRDDSSAFVGSNLLRIIKSEGIRKLFRLPLRRLDCRNALSLPDMFCVYVLAHSFSSGF